MLIDSEVITYETDSRSGIISLLTIGIEIEDWGMMFTSLVIPIWLREIPIYFATVDTADEAGSWKLLKSIEQGFSHEVSST